MRRSRDAAKAPLIPTPRRKGCTTATVIGPCFCQHSMELFVSLVFGGRGVSRRDNYRILFGSSPFSCGPLRCTTVRRSLAPFQGIDLRQPRMRRCFPTSFTGIGKTRSYDGAE